MTLVRWNPVRDLATLQSQVDRFVDTLGASATWPEARTTFFPAVDVEESGDAYVLRAELPGVRKEDVKVHLIDNVLTIKGEKRIERTQTQAPYLHSERASGSFERSFTLGTPIKPDSVSARYTDGLLEVRVTKSETQKLKEIAID